MLLSISPKRISTGLLLTWQNIILIASDAGPLRSMFRKGEFIVTIYAVDKFRQEKDDYPKDKLPVKKFKLFLKWEEFFPHKELRCSALKRGL